MTAPELTWDEAEANRRLREAERVIAVLREHLDELEPGDEGRGGGCVYCDWMRGHRHQPDCPYAIVVGALVAYDAATAEEVE